MTSIKVKLRPSATGREGSIYYQVIHGRTVRQIGTGYRLYDGEWDRETSSVRIMPETGENRKRYLRGVAEHVSWDTRRLEAIAANATGKALIIPRMTSSGCSKGSPADNPCPCLCKKPSGS